MDSIRIIRNENIEKVLVGIPKNHKHIRACIELRDKSIVIFQEATIANILRVYTNLKTHPTIRAQELKNTVLDKTTRKEGYASHQLLETSRNQDEIEEQISKYLQKPIASG